MIEITNRFRVKVHRYLENGEYDGWFVSPVFAVSGNEKCFLVYDIEDHEQEGGFKWVDFTKERVEFFED